MDTRLTTFFRRAGPALVLAALAGALSSAGVFAHANPVRSAPSPDDVVADAPGQVAVWFDAAVVPANSGIRLLDRGGQTVATGSGSPTGEPNLVAISVPPLGPGTYTAVWQNVDVADGHANAGYYSFSVGRPDPALNVSPASDNRSGSRGTIALSITPQDDGRHRFEVTALDGRGAPVGDVQRVILRARMQDPAAGPTTVDAAPTGSGQYAATAGLMGVPGAYELEVIVRQRSAQDWS